MENMTTLKMKKLASLILLYGSLFLILFSVRSHASDELDSEHTSADAIKRDLDTFGWNLSNSALLRDSQISYRAEGGFSGVESYGVIISCVRGKISVLKSLYNPKLGTSRSRIRQIGSMDKKTYLNLWAHLKKHSVVAMKDCPQPSEDIHDEFTVSFHTKVGGQTHKFKVYGIGRPEASRYFALRCLIDTAANMKSIWDIHEGLAMRHASSEIH
jgi:hypothetical protein